jgi:hypothetical protein
MEIKKRTEAIVIGTTQGMTELLVKKQEIKKEKAQESENLGAEKQPP